MGSAIEIESISFKVVSGEKVFLEEFQIYLGHSSLDELEPEFDDNYISGTKTRVFNQSDVWLYSPGPGEWMTIELEDSFWYNGSDNLLVDFAWPSGESAIYVMGWSDSDVDRSVNGEYDNPIGTQSPESLLLRFNGTLSLEPATFGSIKATLGM